MRYLLVSVAMIPCLAWAGWSSNGGDQVRDQNNPWYLGAAAVPYCVEAATGYPVAKSALREIVQESLEDWRRFFQKYELDKKEFGGDTLRFKDGTRRGLSLRFEESSDCMTSSGEPRDEKLVFLFGGDNRVVKQVRESGSPNALALSIRRDFNHTAFRNGGIVWFDAFTPERNRLKHLILHEIGHVFGMRHNSVFVMDESVAAEVQNPLVPALLGQIESPRWKYRLRNGDAVDFSAEYGGNAPNAGIPEELRNVLKLRKDGTHRFRMTYEEVGPHLKQRRLTATLEDGATGARHVFQGGFGYVHAEAAPTLGPSLYTEWMDASKSAAEFSRAELDDARSAFPAKGSFWIVNGNYATVIGNERGPNLKLFTPYSAEWWTVSGRTQDRSHGLE